MDQNQSDNTPVRVDQLILNRPADEENKSLISLYLDDL